MNGGVGRAKITGAMGGWLPEKMPVTNFSRAGTYLVISVLMIIFGDTVMASSARIFFAGVATTFAILGVGFGGGLLMANSTLKAQAAYQVRATPEPPSPVRVILPASAEPARPPQQQTPQQDAAAMPALEPVKAVLPEKLVERPDARKLQAEVRERRKRYAERKAKREAARARQQLEARGQEAPVMAFGGDDNSRLALFGN